MLHFGIIEKFSYLPNNFSPNNSNNTVIHFFWFRFHLSVRQSGLWGGILFTPWCFWRAQGSPLCYLLNWQTHLWVIVLQSCPSSFMSRLLHLCSWGWGPPQGSLWWARVLSPDAAEGPELSLLAPSANPASDQWPSPVALFLKCLRSSSASLSTPAMSLGQPPSPFAGNKPHRPWIHSP